MKKNITINLCRRLYQIDEDAYELLNQYIETLRNYFTKQEGGNEIADDIEERIAELFDELKTNGTEAIAIENVQNIIKQIGNIKDITDEDEAEQKTENEKQKTKENEDGNGKKKKDTGKKYYRDGSNKVICGVLSGCAQFYGSNANTWRWCYVVLSILWLIFIHSAMYVSFSIRELFFLQLYILKFAFYFAPVIAYFLFALLTTEANTPEDSLKMKGKEVNPQNLVAEVTAQSALQSKRKIKSKNDLSGWDLFVGILSILLSVFVGINFIAVLCIDIVMFFLPENHQWLGIKTEIVQSDVIYYAIISGIILLVSISILLYCSIHSAASSFKKTTPMSILQRVIWLVLWVISVTVFVGFVMSTVKEYQIVNAKLYKIEQAKYKAYEKSHTHNGFLFNDEDWKFFQNCDWTLVKAEHTDRYTYNGQYMDENEETRYLDAYNDIEPVIYTVEKTDSVQPGVYRLSAAVRADNTGRFIFAGVGKNCPIKLAEIPVYEGEGGNIWEIATSWNNVKNDSIKSTVAKYQRIEEKMAFTYKDPIIKELVDKLAPSTKRKIRESNEGKGLGWNYIYINNIIVNQPSTITYGITTDEDITGIEPTTGWFSATDFKLERISHK